ncbi:ribosomal RNA large subunit methyltransferaseK/L [Striga asiatica]|uniref:Ribosomal RNA large subunit methyltransferaseK/L n=1 Tax=Striga asiatica TaxID=4170 RepID=A0A5A7PTY2_STRAF|nr:ribosomal RNA large subunit methyltransferaseK/L [Striga asiatica]
MGVIHESVDFPFLQLLSIHSATGFLLSKWKGIRETPDKENTNWESKETNYKRPRECETEELPLSVQAAMPTAGPSTASIRAILCGGLPHGLPRLRRGHSLCVNTWIHPRHSWPAHHWLPHGRVIVGHAGHPSCSRWWAHDPLEGRHLILDFIPRHNINQKIKYVGARDSSGDVILLERAALVLLRVEPRSHGELEYEELARLGEEYWGLCRYHAHVLVGLHDLLDAGQRELVIFEIVHLLDLLALKIPERLEMMLLLFEEVVVGGLRRVPRGRLRWGRALLQVVLFHGSSARFEGRE